MGFRVIRGFAPAPWLLAPCLQSTSAGMGTQCQQPYPFPPYLYKAVPSAAVSHPCLFAANATKDNSRLSRRGLVIKIFLQALLILLWLP